jgi:hypothetical protein
MTPQPAALDRLDQLGRRLDGSCFEEIGEHDAIVSGDRRQKEGDRR